MNVKHRSIHTIAGVFYKQKIKMAIKGFLFFTINILIPDHNYDMKCFVSFEKHTFNQHCFFRVIFMLLLLSTDIFSKFTF